MIFYSSENKILIRNYPEMDIVIFFAFYVDLVKNQVE